jgi:hypothetical protein
MYLETRNLLERNLRWLRRLMPGPEEGAVFESEAVIACSDEG